MNKYLKLAVKFVLVVGLLVFLGKRGFLSVEATGKAFARWDLMIPATLLSITGIIFGSIRWLLLLRAQGIQLGFMRVFELNLVGAFFNIALPGAVTGDLVKAFYVGKEVDGVRAKAFGSILFDRIVGVSALAIVSAGALLMELDRFQGSVLLNSIQAFVLSAAAGVLVFYLYLFAFHDSNDPILKVLQKLAKNSRPADSIMRTFLGIKVYRNHFGIVALTLAMSIFVHLMICTTALLFLNALGVEGVPSAAVFVVTPLGLLVTAIPVMPAGVGTGHAAFLWLFGFLGTDRGADVFTLIALFNILFGMVGGLVYLRFKAKDPASMSVGDGALTR